MTTQDNPSTPPAHPPHKILVVDDEVDMATALAALLNGCGYEAHVVNDGASALAQCKQLDPDIMILDIVMPGMSGLEVLRKCRERWGRERPRILLTSGAVDDITMLPEHPLADGFLLKPWTLEVLQDEVAKLVVLLEQSGGPKHRKHRLWPF